MPYPIGLTRILLDRDRVPANNLEEDICSLASASLIVTLFFWFSNHRLYLFSHGPQKGTQFTRDGSSRYLAWFAFGQQPTACA